MASTQRNKKAASALDAKIKEIQAGARKILLAKYPELAKQPHMRQPTDETQRAPTPKPSASRASRQIPPLNGSEFKKLPKDSYAFKNAWGSKRPIKTPAGLFRLEFFMLYDAKPPDTEMLTLAAELARYAQTHSKYIREIIHAHYLYYVTEYGPDYLFCDMPSNLKPEQIWKYCDPVLVVERNEPATAPAYETRITANPEWEPEHNLSMEYADGAIVTVNRGPFKIVKGILRQK